MRNMWIACLMLATASSAVCASENDELIGARLWLHQYVSESLSEERVAQNSGSYRKAAHEVLTKFFAKYRELIKLSAPELNDEQLLAAAEVFTGMASVGVEIPRESELYPAIRETADAALSVYEEIKSRRIPTDEAAVATYSAIFALREWELESRMRADMGQFHKLPHIIDDPKVGDRKSLWHLDPDFFTMKRRAFEQSDGTKWIVIAFAGCGVAKNAISDIFHDKELKGLFKGRSIWLTPPGPDSLSFPDVFVWNARYPEFALKFIHHMDEWPALDMAPASPTFVRIEDGAVVGMHSGWGSGKYLSRTREALLNIEEKAQ